jgi:hypothetical protein
MKFRLKEERRFEMSQKDKHVYQYIPNSVPETKAKMPRHNSSSIPGNLMGS